MTNHLIFLSSGIQVLLRGHTIMDVSAIVTIGIVPIMIGIILFVRQTRAAHLLDLLSMGLVISCFTSSCYKVLGAIIICPDIWYLSAHALFCCIGRGTDKVKGNLHLCTEVVIRQKTESIPP